MAASGGIVAKKSSGGGFGFILLLIIGAIAAVPKEVWIAAAIIGGICLVAYLIFGRSKPSEPARSPATRQKSVDRFVIGTGGGGDADRSVTSQQCWVPPGGSFNVSGRAISGGMVYVGSRLPAITAYGIEPAAIDPKLPVRRIGSAPRMQYWPSYSTISAEARGEYLDWLAGGRTDPNAQMGCVFLFFYGLERRALHDVQTMPDEVRKELSAIEAEVQRLLGIYSESSSFQGYATAFLDALRWGSVSNNKIYEGEPPAVPRWRHLAMTHKVALAQMARDGVPLPAAWAYAWLMADPMTSIRKPAERCPEEFRRLFAAMYNQRYDGGMALPRNKTRLKLSYRPASASFGTYVERDVGDLPDVSVLERPIGALRSLASEAADALDPYSRFVGKNPNKCESMDAVVLLPPMLWPRQSMVNLMTWLRNLGVDREMQAASVPELMRHFPAWGAMNKERAAAFAASLEHFGAGMEPDSRWGGPIPTDEGLVVLFAIPPAERGKKPSPVYSAAALTMHLAAAVSHADNVTAQEEERLEESLEELLHLQSHERLRLRAHLKWLLLAKPSLTAMKKRVSALAPAQRNAMASFVVSAAQADGDVTPVEMKVLGKIFRLLELPEEQLFSMAHAAATEPVTVKQRTTRAERFSIPKKPSQPGGAALDAERIAALKEESNKVSKVLSTIFAGAEGAQEEHVEQEPVAEAPASPVGLDPEHDGFVALLCGRQQWSRVELEDLASDRGIMLDGALEKVNDAFIEKFGAPLVEGHDPMEVNQQVVREMQPA